MSDKYLTVKEWQKFAKDKDFKDAALLKALAATEKAEKDGPLEQLKVLFELEEAGQALYKLNKGDKKLESYLEDVYKALKKWRKEAEKAVERLAEEDEEAGDDNNSPVLLQHKLIPLLRQVKKGNEMQVLIAVAGKQAAVLLAKRTISPGRIELLKTWLGETAIKRIKGVCIFENKAHTFVVDTQAAGLAKKLKAALLAQTELRLKVRVRGLDPNDVDEELGDDADDELDDEGSEAETEQGAGQAPLAEPPSADALQARYEARLAELEPLALAALKAQHAEAGKIRAVADFAREKGRDGNFKSALAALESLAKLLGLAAAATPAPEPPPPAAPAEAPSVDPGAAFNARLAALMPRVKAALAAAGAGAQDLKLKVSEAGMFARKKEFERAHGLLDEAERLLGAETDVPPPPPPRPPAAAGPRVAYTKARLDWERTRRQVQAELRRLEAMVLEECREEEDFATIKSNTHLLYTVLDHLDERLIDKLDELLMAASADDRRRLQTEAREIVDEYIDYVKTDKVLHVIADNGFVDINIMSLLNNCLADLAQQIKPIAA